MNFDNIKVNLQYFLPKHILTRTVGLLAGAKLGKVTTFAIEQFANFYDVNLEEMEGDISNYQTFNDFFARPLMNPPRRMAPPLQGKTPCPLRSPAFSGYRRTRAREYAVRRRFPRTPPAV